MEISSSQRSFPRLPISAGSIPRLLHTAFLFCLFPLTMAQEISYEVTEEVDIGHQVGNLVTDLRLEVDSDTRFQFLSTHLPNETYFGLDDESGELTTIRRIDREDPNLCPENEPVCTYHMEIIVLPYTAYRFINVHVTILDKNDHKPEFPDPVMFIEVRESVAVGTKIPMENAYDADIGNDIHYSLSTDHGGIFGLVQTSYLNGSLSIQLQINAPLDREARDRYELLLLAVDDGEPQSRTGSTLLNVTVLDSNDHSPRFKRPEYTVNIAENLAVGTEVLKVEAQDPDLGNNGQIIYGFISSVHFFDIESDTGVIRTHGRLDYEIHQSFQFIIKCTNNVPNPVPDFASVTINIIDVNDNRPSITVNAIEGGANFVYIPEDSEPGSPLAFIRVSDPDSGSSGEVHVILSDHYGDFELQTVSANHQYFLAIRRDLDREELAVYNISVIAEDNGDPILRRQRQFVVFLKDINDNPPFFSKPVFYATITENNDKNTFLTQVLAMDEDEGENATVVYSLANNQNSFAIDEVTGDLTATIVLDREVASDIPVTVTACDTGRPEPMCANVTVRVTVLDENDNAPEFLLSEYEFGVYENRNVGTLVGQVETHDNDIGDNASVEYTILTEQDRYYFRIDRSTGEIFTQVMLDREEQASYAITVMANEYGKMIMAHSATVTVRISVMDDNDNAPNILYPNPHDNIVFIPLHAPPGFVVAKVDAKDKDDGDNARLSFGISDGNIYDIFRMNKRGEFVTSNSLKQQWAGVHSLILRVKDGGRSSLETTSQLIVVIADMNFNESIREDAFFQLYNMTVDTFLKKDPDTGQTNKWPIVVGIALGCLAFTLLIIFLVVTAKYRDKYRSRENQYAEPCANTIEPLENTEL